VQREFRVAVPTDAAYFEFRVDEPVVPPDPDGRTAAYRKGVRADAGTPPALAAAPAPVESSVSAATAP
jgi:hypothetical protein